MKSRTFHNKICARRVAGGQLDFISIHGMKLSIKLIECRMKSIIGRRRWLSVTFIIFSSKQWHQQSNKLVSSTTTIKLIKSLLQTASDVRDWSAKRTSNKVLQHEKRLKRNCATQKTKRVIATVELGCVLRLMILSWSPVERKISHCAISSVIDVRSHVALTLRMWLRCFCCSWRDWKRQQNELKWKGRNQLVGLPTILAQCDSIKLWNESNDSMETFKAPHNDVASKVLIKVFFQWASNYVHFRDIVEV